MMIGNIFSSSPLWPIITGLLGANFSRSYLRQADKASERPAGDSPLYAAAT
jgi:hypothetical protein